ncbi:transglycosylase domain-containing protein [Evansella sp. AB-rgal1]|uniref:transglycosylase domain-containing protein n=1 Tax=Evansella sp. AB-rgal1 TaxID=3242696 RepID=UPI00359D691B
MRPLTGTLFILIFIIFFSLITLFTFEEWHAAKSLPLVLDESINLTDFTIAKNSVIVDSNNNKLSDIYSSENRIYLPYEEIPKTVVDALLAAEDQQFFSHKGFDIKGIARALLVNIQSDSLEQGGSTVTQQLVRNLFLTHDKSYERKISELLYAYQMEQQMTKEQIIELYVNVIYFKNGVYGMEAASRFYFNKKADDLTVAEVAFLSAIPNNPERFNPLKNKENTHARKEWILLKMFETHVINEETYIAALDEEISLNLYKKVDLYPDYVTYVYHELRQLVGEKEGYFQRMDMESNEEKRMLLQIELEMAVAELLQDGVTIETAFIPHIQQEVSKAIDTNLSNSKLQVGTTVIDHTQNEIVAISGGVNYEKFGFHRAYQSFRQPGSAIKPLLVYAPYIEETGSNAKTTIDASSFVKNGYQPQNYGRASYGRVSMEAAFKHSYNTAAVRVLDTMGVTTAFEYFSQLGFERVSMNDMILPAALGGIENGVSVLEMTRAYSTFATGGVYESPKAIRRVVGNDGRVLYAWDSDGVQVLSEETTLEIRKMMNKVVTEGTGRNAHFSTSGYIGGKTGTTNNYHDLWFVGSTDRYTSGIWLGYDTPSSMNNVNQRLHLTIWRAYMSQIEKVE